MVTNPLTRASRNQKGRVKGLRLNEADRWLTNICVLAGTQSTLPISFEEGRLLVNRNS